MTFIAYPNISASSGNGRFRLEITGTPGNEFFRDQSCFVYQLYQSDQLAWEWLAGALESGKRAFLDDYPHEAWVSDEGWVVVRTHEWFRSGLLVLSPDGHVVLRRLHRRLTQDEQPGFLDTEPEQYMGDTSAGPFWARSAIAYFTHSRGRSIWVIRTWWGRRVVIDLENADFLNPSAVDAGLARNLEIGWIDNSLKVGVAKLEEEGEKLQAAGEDRRDWSIIKPVMAAAYQAGWLQAESSVPYLRRMEALEPMYRSVSYGPVRWGVVITLPFRQIAKLSLLRVGHEPRWLPHYGFELRDDVLDKKDLSLETFPLPAQGLVRDAGLLEPGLTQIETLQRIGAPDFINSNYWEYDSYSPGARHTARIMWDNSYLLELPHETYKVRIAEKPRRIAKIETLEPQWKQITRRDHHIV
jgi:hypothetical protein